ncbi:hypothetical protein [Priestia filamentosa]|uniref:hypothetical protein n=1 Tax=Priestia filamentosa TaxID=1402861 RepID=UPI00397C0D40
MKILKSKVIPIVLTATIATGFAGSVSASAQTSSSTSSVAVQSEPLKQVKSNEVNQEAKLKILASALRAGGWVLEKMLSPFSKRGADAVKKYRFKIADVLDKTERVTEDALTTSLTKVGIPRDVARDIAKIVVSIVL